MDDSADVRERGGPGHDREVLLNIKSFFSIWIN